MLPNVIREGLLECNGKVLDLISKGVGGSGFSLTGDTVLHSSARHFILQLFYPGRCLNITTK